ncbi:MAG: DciA family protein [Cruoricaptor ignavus]|nr:DciA family protein [Cruoricaptor ignavus]
MRRKKKEFQSSELVKSFAQIYGFEDKLLALEIKDFLEIYLDSAMFEDIESVNLNQKILAIKVFSPLLKNDLRLRKSFLLKKIQEKFGENHINDLLIL